MTKLLATLFLVLFVLGFGLIVWPTPYQYIGLSVSATGQFGGPAYRIYRVNRITHRVSVWDGDAWTDG